MALKDSYSIVAGSGSGIQVSYRGFSTTTPTHISTAFGTINGGTSAPTAFGGSASVHGFFTYSNPGGYGLEFYTTGVPSESYYDYVTIDGNTYNRVDASITYPASYHQRRVWSVGYTNIHLTSGSTYTAEVHDSNVAPTAHTSLGLVAGTTEASTTSVTFNPTGGSLGTPTGTVNYNRTATSVTPPGPTTNWITSNFYTTNNRGTTYRYWSRIQNSVSSAIKYEDFTVPYLAPTEPSTTYPSNIGQSATSFTFSYGSPTALPSGHTLKLEYNNSGTWTQIGSSLTTTTGNITVNGAALPSIGGSEDYRVLVRRASNVGGDNAYDVVESFTVTRDGYTLPDTSITVENNTPLFNSSSFQVRLTNTTSTTSYEIRSSSYSGTVLQTITNQNNVWVTVNNQPSTSGTTYYITAFVSTANGGDETRSNVTTFTVTRNSEVNPDTAITQSPSGDITTSNSTFTKSITNANSNGVTDYRLLRTTGTDTEYDTNTDASTSFDLTGDMPSSGSWTYVIQARVPTADNGDNVWVNAGSSFTVTRSSSGSSSGGTTYNEYGSTTDITRNIFNDDLINLYYNVQGADTNKSWFISDVGCNATPGAGFFYSGHPTGSTFMSYLDNFSGSSYSAEFFVDDVSKFTISGTVTDPYGVTNITFGSKSVDPGNGTTTTESVAQTFDTFREGETLDYSVSGGELYNGSAWGTSGTVTDGASIKLRGITPSIYSGSKTVTVTFSKNSVTKRTESFVINTPSLTAPTDIQFSNAGTASATEQVTVTATGGYGGTVKVSNDGTNWEDSGHVFDHARNSSVTYYARREHTGSTPSSSYSESHSVGYLAPLAFSYTVSDSDPLAYGDAGFNVTIAGADANHTYKVLYGSTSAGTRTTNGDIAITGSELPSAGSVVTYTVQVVRAASNGGSGSYVTDSTFTRSMRPSTPTVSVSTATTASNLTDVTVTGSSTGATEYRFSEDGTNYTSWTSSTSHVFEDQTRGTSYTYYVQSRSSSADSLVGSTSVTTPYLAPAAFSYAVSDSDPLAYNDSGFNVTISGADTGHTYQVLHNGSPAGDISTNGNILISGSELPSAGGIKTYTVRAKRSVAAGGDNLYDSVYSFTRSMRPSNPTRVISGFGTEASATASHYISASSTGATEYRFKVSPAINNSGVFSAWQSSNTFTFDTTSYGVTRGDDITTVVEARSTNAAAAGDLSHDSTVTYINPDLGLAGTSSTIDRGDTTATSTLSSATSGDSYVVRANNGSTNLSNVLTDNGTFTISSGLPAIGSVTTYEIFAKRPIADGGSNTYIGSNDTFTVTRYGNPTVDTFATSNATPNSGQQYSITGTFSDPQSETVSWSLERKTGTGGTYAQISSGTGSMSVNQSLAVAADTTYYYRVKISALDSDTITSSEVSVTVSAASLTTVDITSVGDITPDENTSDQVEATTTTNNGVTVSSYAWTKTGSISISNTTVQNPTITFGDVTSNSAASLTVTVTDSLGRTVQDTQNYTIQFINQGPLATLSGTQAVLQNEEVNLTASGSYDPDGFALQYQFSTTNGTETFTQAYGSSETFSFTPTETGTYTTTVTVKDTSNATATALFSTIVSEAQDPNAGSGGGYGFEVYNAAGDAVIRSDELIIRKVTTVSLDGNGDGSTSVALPDSSTELIASGQSDAETDGGVAYSVSVVNSTATVTIAAPGYTSVDLYMVK